MAGATQNGAMAASGTGSTSNSWNSVLKDFLRGGLPDVIDSVLGQGPATGYQNQPVYTIMPTTPLNPERGMEPPIGSTGWYVGGQLPGGNQTWIIGGALIGSVLLMTLLLRR